MKLLSSLQHIFKNQYKLLSVLDKPGCIFSFNLRDISYSQPLYQWGKNKKHRNVKLKWYFDNMSDPQTEEILAPLRASVKEQVTANFKLYKIVKIMFF